MKGGRERAEEGIENPTPPLTMHNFTRRRERDTHPTGSSTPGCGANGINIANGRPYESCWSSESLKTQLPVIGGGDDKERYSGVFSDSIVEKEHVIEGVALKKEGISKELRNFIKIN